MELIPPNYKFGGGGERMADRWSDEFSTRVREWCDDVAALGVDVLADAGLVSRADFERAADIVAEEMFVRLCLLDYPPSPEAPGRAEDAEPITAVDPPRAAGH